MMTSITPLFRPEGRRSFCVDKSEWFERTFVLSRNKEDGEWRAPAKAKYTFDYMPFYKSPHRKELVAAMKIHLKGVEIPEKVVLAIYQMTSISPPITFLIEKKTSQMYAKVLVRVAPRDFGHFSSQIMYVKIEPAAWLFWVRVLGVLVFAVAVVFFPIVATAGVLCLLAVTSFECTEKMQDRADLHLAENALRSKIVKLRK